MANSPDKNVVELPDFEAIEGEAARWLARLNADNVSDDDRVLFQEWRVASPRHVAAFDRLADAWTAFDKLGALKPEERQEKEPRAGWFSSRPLNALIDGFRTFAIVRPVAAYSAAFSVFILAISPIVLTAVQFGPSQPELLVFQTDVGEQETVNLADGSSVFLNTASRIEVRYGASARDLRLLSGEAHFDVAKHKNRPFSVYAGDGVVRAVGTAFTVRLNDDAIEVTVTEGDVALATYSETRTGAPDNQQTVNRIAPAPLTNLTAGHHAIFSSEVEAVDPITDGEINRRLAWRQGMLSYAGEPLGHVIDDIGRYTDLKIVATDGGFEDISVSGHFKIEELDAIFDVFEVTFGLTVDRSEDGVVYISL